MNNKLADVAIVIIGRNEGERLKKCIESVSSIDAELVYVDSGSTDDSVIFCKSRGVHVVELDMSVPFSAARARNEGFNFIKTKLNLPQYIQFVDGDCIVEHTWVKKAVMFLSQQPDVAVVCGVLNELHPDRTIFNQLCDIEWDGPKGNVRESGGIFMVRSEIFDVVEGFNSKIIAGEEPELCFRIRSLGKKIFRLDETMAYHDANITSITQWWKRTLRSGHAYAQGYDLHGNSAELFNRKQIRSIIAWGGVIPILFILTLLFLGMGAAFLVLLLPLILFAKVFVYIIGDKQLELSIAFIFTSAIVVGKIPQALGVWQFYKRKLTNKDAEIIEYK